MLGFSNDTHDCTNPDTLTYNASCHVIGTTWPKYLTCELQEECDLHMLGLSLDRCGNRGAYSNFAIVEYKCLQGETLIQEIKAKPIFNTLILWTHLTHRIKWETQFCTWIKWKTTFCSRNSHQKTFVPNDKSALVQVMVGGIILSVLESILHNSFFCMNAWPGHSDFMFRLFWSWNQFHCCFNFCKQNWRKLRFLLQQSVDNTTYHACKKKGFHYILQDPLTVYLACMARHAVATGAGIWLMTSLLMEANRVGM